MIANRTIPQALSFAHQEAIKWSPLEGVPCLNSLSGDVGSRCFGVVDRPSLLGNGEQPCPQCRGAADAMKWAAQLGEVVMRDFSEWRPIDGAWRLLSPANDAARIESLFGEPGPWAAFRDLIRKLTQP